MADGTSDGVKKGSNPIQSLLLGLVGVALLATAFYAGTHSGTAAGENQNGQGDPLIMQASSPNNDPEIAVDLAKRSLQAIADTEKKVIDAIDSGHLNTLSSELQQSLQKSHSRVRQQMIAKFKSGIDTSKVEIARRAKFGVEKEEVNVQVTEAGKRKKGKFAKRRSVQQSVEVVVDEGKNPKKVKVVNVTAVESQVRNFTFEEMFIDHPDLFTLTDLQEITIEKRVKSVYVFHGIPNKPLISTKTHKEVPPVLLLHGSKFSAATWDVTGTIQAIVDAGYHVYAVDLPGYGRSEGKVDSPLREVFLKGLIDKLGVKKPFIVAPSMSGSFAVPYVRDFPTELSGFVPIAAVRLKTVSVETWEKLANDIWVMYIYGEKDVDIGAPGAKFFEKAPSVEIFEMKQGTHPCYLDKPKQFNQKLLKFFNRATRGKEESANGVGMGMGVSNGKSDDKSMGNNKNKNK